MNAPRLQSTRSAVSRPGSHFGVLRDGSLHMVRLSLDFRYMRELVAVRRAACRFLFKCIGPGSREYRERRRFGSRVRSRRRGIESHNRHSDRRATCGCRGRMDSAGQIMRVSRAALGQIQQTTCAAAGGVWNASTNTCTSQPAQGSSLVQSTPPPTSPAAPTTPVGYNEQTGTVSGNTSGQTVSGLSPSSQGLCVQEGGTWNGSSCSFSGLCTQFPFGGVYNSSTGQCSYLNFYLTLGGIALFAFVLIAMSRK